jgi:hypothetical protein
MTSQLRNISMVAVVVAFAGCGHSIAGEEAGGITLNIQRLSMGSGDVLVSSGIPLPPGAVTPTQLKQIKISIAGKEQSLYVEALKGTHKDGSLRSVLVQFRTSLMQGQSVTGKLEFQGRGTTDLARTDVTWSTPDAVALPTNPDYLVTTLLVGKTVTVAKAPKDMLTQKWDADYVRFGDMIWAGYGTDWEKDFNAYYDHALNAYARWVRSGEEKWWERATGILVDYRTNYLEPANGSASPQWMLPEGLAAHYWLTGDPKDLDMIGKMADFLSQGWPNNNTSSYGLGSWRGKNGTDADVMNHTAVESLEQREQARVLLTYIHAWMLGLPSVWKNDWGKLLKGALPLVLSTQQPDGGYIFGAICFYQHAWMTGIFHDALTKYYDYFDADATIPPALKKGLDHMWTTLWLPDSKSFEYLSGACPDNGGTESSAPLNLLTVYGFGWYANQSGDSKYKDIADQIFSAGMTQGSDADYLSYPKVYNQYYYDSFLYIALR